MHELSLAEDVLRIIEQAALRDGFGRVRTVRLEIGALSCVEPEAMAFCFDSVTAGSIAAGARLEIRRSEGLARCERCGEAVRIASLGNACPRCGDYRLRVTGGEALRVIDLDVE